MIINAGQKALYQTLDIVPAIITKEHFKEVATEKERRSNITRTDVGRTRKSTHYSMKKLNVKRLNKPETEQISN